MARNRIDSNHVMQARVHLFGDAALIPNHFLSLRSFDDVSCRPLVSKDGRSETIEEHEGFSTHLWNMSTAIGFNEAASRYLHESDGGVSCLKELSDCAGLLAGRQPSID